MIYKTLRIKQLKAQAIVQITGVHDIKHETNLRLTQKELS